MVILLWKRNYYPWRVILRAEQFVWHNKEFPATLRLIDVFSVAAVPSSLTGNAVIFLHGADRSYRLEI